MRGGRGGACRAATLAALSALLTAVGHVAGGGTVPGLAVLIVLFPLLAGVMVTLADRAATAMGTVATLAAGQLVLHQLMVLMHPAHVVSEPAVPPGAAMLGMHAVVTLATAVALRYADRAVLVVAAALRRVVLRRLTAPPADRPLPTRALPGPAVPALLARALAVANARRGPPVGC